MIDLNKHLTIFDQTFSKGHRITEDLADFCILVCTQCCFTGTIRVINVRVVGTKGLGEKNILFCAS